MNLTIVLWLLSFVLIACTFHFTKKWKQKQLDFMSVLLRLFFCVMVGLSSWIIFSYSFWLAGFQLSIGTIQDGKMADNWWLPFAVFGWTILLFFAAKPKN